MTEIAYPQGFNKNSIVVNVGISGAFEDTKDDYSYGEYVLDSVSAYTTGAMKKYTVLGNENILLSVKWGTEKGPATQMRKYKIILMKQP